MIFLFGWFKHLGISSFSSLSSFYSLACFCPWSTWIYLTDSCWSVSSNDGNLGYPSRWKSPVLVLDWTLTHSVFEHLSRSQGCSLLLIFPLCLGLFHTLATLACCPFLVSSSRLSHNSSPVESFSLFSPQVGLETAIAHVFLVISLKVTFAIHRTEKDRFTDESILHSANRHVISDMYQV